MGMRGLYSIDANWREGSSGVPTVFQLKLVWKQEGVSTFSKVSLSFPPQGSMKRVSAFVIYQHGNVPTKAPNRRLTPRENRVVTMHEHVNNLVCRDT